MEIILDEKQILTVFLFELKMGCKAGEVTHNINDTSSPETANKLTGQWWFNKFCKGDKSLQDERSGQPREGDKNQLS